MKRISNLIMKTLCFLIIFITLFIYQKEALNRQQLMETNAKEIKEVEEYNAKILNQSNESQISYKDGTYEGSADGFGGKITVKVVVKNKKINSIDVTSHDGEDDTYYAMAEKVIDDLMEKQTTEIDSVSGATFSSTGIIEATKNALEKAV